MSTRATWAHELAGRCRRVGWDVERTSDGYKVVGPDRKSVVFHLTESKRQAETVTLHRLEAMGLTGAEVKLAQKEARAKARKLAAERKAAEAQAAKMAQRSGAVARAAGPYAELEEVEDNWFLTAHPAPWVRWCLIGPEQARRVLDKINTRNRHLSQSWIDRYVRIQVSGQWRSTHQGMAIDSNGVLQDGQHRLHAIVEAGLPAPVFVFVGMDPDNFKAIDEGRLRNAGQLLAMEGEKFATTATAAVRLAHAYGAPDPRRMAGYRPGNLEIFDAFQADAQRVRDAVAWARGRPFRKIGVPPSVLAAARLVLGQVNGDANPYVATFFDGFLAGTQPGTRILLDDDDPRTALRNWFANRSLKKVRAEAIDLVAIIVRAWNYLVENRRQGMLRTSIVIPAVLVCRPDGDNPSAPPPLIADEVTVVLG